MLIFDWYANVYGGQWCVLVPGTLQPPAANPAPTFKYLNVLLSAAPGAPTIADFERVDFSAPGPRPLAALNVGNPRGVYGLLYKRAQGDFAEYLRLNPNTARAKMERFVLVQYPTTTQLAPARAALRAEHFVIAAEELIDFKFSANEQHVAKGPIAKGGTPTGQNQYHLSAINIDTAWLRAGGWGFVGLADSGLMMEHPNLRAFVTGANSVVSHVPGGNFLGAASFDVGNLPQSAGPNIDERKGVPSPAEACDLLDGIDDNLMRLSFAGHGTHTSGLVGANVRNTNFIEGVCRNCGIGMWKINTPLCQVDANNVGFVSSDIGPAAIPNAITFLTDIGAQTINLSFGQQVTTPDAFCAGQPNSAYCIALDVARENDVVLVASSGNNRRSPQFPARDLRTIAVGGTDPTGAFWDRLANPFGFCPFPQSEVECGSNFSEFNTDRRQEFAVPAVEVRSTMYVGQNWNADLGCGEPLKTVFSS